MMDVDEEIDGMLSTQFDAMNTRDRKDVIAEFQRLVGHHAANVNEAGCVFWLEMFNWNIHQAVGAFFDWQPQAVPSEPTFNMTLCHEFTYADGENISPSTSFQKRWRLKNTGASSWLPGTALRFIGGGSPMGDRDRFPVECVDPGQECDLMVTLESPPLPGQYQGQWRLASPTGTFFGDIIWVVILVEEGGIMGVTQAMKHLSHSVIPDARLSPSSSSSPFARHSPSSSSSFAWTCSPSSDSKLEEEMSPDDVSHSSFDARGVYSSCAATATATAAQPNGLHNPFLSPSPRRGDDFVASSPSSHSRFITTEEPSPPRPVTPENSPYQNRLSRSPIFASFSPPSLSPQGLSPSMRQDIDFDVGSSSSLMAPPLILPPSPPPYTSAVPSVGGFLVPPTICHQRGPEDNSPSISMTDDDDL